MSGNKALVVESYGDPQTDPTAGLNLVDLPVPTPAEGEVLVRLSLRPINPADVFSLCGFYKGFQPESLPAVPGLEGVGVVEAAGPGATKFTAGQRVVACPWPTKTGNGTWQQLCVVPESLLLAVPDSVSDEAAAQFLVNPVTVYGFLEVLKVPQGEYLLQNAANSVLGKQLIALAHKKGIKTINIVRDLAKHEKELKDLGADVVLSSTDDDVPACVQEITGGKGAYAAVDPVGGPFTEKVTQSVRDSGTVIIYSAMGGLTANAGIPDLLYRDVRLRGFWLGPWLANEAENPAKVLSDLMGYLADKTIVPDSGKHYSMTDLASAKEGILASLQQSRGGKLFLEG